MVTMDRAPDVILNELIAVQNDRVQAFELAARETSDTDLRTLFDELASRSHRYCNELSDEVLFLGGMPTTASTSEGRALRTRMELAAALAERDRRAILSSCATGEYAALRTYQEALDSEAAFPVRELVEKQLASLRQDHERIRKLRESTMSSTAAEKPDVGSHSFKLTM